MDAMNPAPRRAAIVLAGGRATRLDGADNARVEVDGRMLVDGVLQAVESCAPIIVVGPDHLVRPGVRVVREDPPFGGPVAALAAAIAELADDVAETWVLACDLPRASGIIALLSDEDLPDGVDAVVLRDADGRAQPLAGRYRTAALRRARAALPRADGVAMRRLTAALRVREVDDPEGFSVDLDTWDDVLTYRAASDRSRAGEEGRRHDRVTG
jgi:molybdopterin-guanine dinucleotide biosynthesis protein A